MRTEKEIRAKLKYLQEQAYELDAMGGVDNYHLSASCSNDAVLLQWVLGELDL